MSTKTEKSTETNPNETHFHNIPEGKVIVTVPPHIQVAMTGVVEAMQDRHGKVRLTYTDGTTETATVDYTIAQEENFFKIVGDVQAAAKR